MNQASVQGTILEIGRDRNGEIPVSLISAAYRASQSAFVMLVLDRVSTKEVDHLLDPDVARSWRNHRGVVYASLRDESAVLRVAASASRVFASSEDFREKLSSRGIKFRDVSEAESELYHSAREAS